MINYRKMEYKDWDEDSFVNLQRQLEDEQREPSTTGPVIAVEFIDCNGSKKCKGFKSEKAMRRWLRRKIEDGTIWEIVGYSDGKRRTIETEYLPI